jgi:hypothetical protein
MVLSTKVEIRLAKAEPITWTSLDYKGKPKAPQKINAPGNFLNTGKFVSLFGWKSLL